MECLESGDGGFGGGREGGSGSSATVEDTGDQAISV